jgi:Holliday junction DNA helicase RuvB
MSSSKLFPDTIGQEQIKKQLAFFIKGFKATDIMPHLLFTAPKGCGKTHMAKAVARNLVKKGEKKCKPLLEINCASLKNVRQLFNQVIIPYANNADVTLLFDECSELPKDITMAMLTILNPNKDYRNTFAIEEYTVDFNFRQQTFIFCTTEGQSLFHALVDRLERVDLEEYTFGELGKIVKLGLDRGVTVDANAMDEISKVLRGNARSAQKMAMKVNQYCHAERKKKFKMIDWKKFTDHLAIQPLGLLQAEIRLLRELAHVKAMRLTQLASKLGMSRQAVQYDYEVYLQKLGLIGIDPQGRYLTPSGKEYLKQI